MMAILEHTISFITIIILMMMKSKMKSIAGGGDALSNDCKEHYDQETEKHA